MHFVNKTAAIISFSCAVLALVLLAPLTTHGDEWNLATRFTVNHPFEVPNMVLQQNTPYVIRLYDSPAERHVVQIYNSDQTRMLTMFMAVSDERLEPADKTLFTFIETQPGYPLPFIYPKQQATEIAKHALEPVLAANAGDLHKLNSVTVESIGPIGTEAPVAESAANITKSESTAVVEEKPSAPEEQPSIAENAPTEPAVEQQAQATETQKTETEVQREKPAEAPAAAEAPAVPETPTSPELPRTAGELPLIALIGVLCLGAGLGMKVISSNN
jgi:hypothetical protein